MAAFLENLIVFGRVLRSAEVDVPVGAVLDAIDALTLVDVNRRDDVFFTCRAIFVRRREQLMTFETVFNAFWRDHGNPFAGHETVNARDPRTEAALAAAAAAVLAGNPADSESDSVAQDLEGIIQTWSDSSALARKDFAEYSPQEEAQARLAIERLEWLPGQRRTRRWVRGRGPRVDLRQALARSVRTRGDVVGLPTRKRRIRPRRLVLLCDVSGSMERYSRLLLHFAHGLGQQHRRVEAFVFSTSLTRVTRQLRARSINRAASAVSETVPHWSGGTRIGHALQQFRRHWSRRVLRQGPVVLLISDGWDRGDPGLLREQVAWLQRSCHRLIWLNPLVGTTGFEPLTRGLKAALPFVDDFLPARTLSDLSQLALHLESVGERTRHRRAHHKI
jgi:uncharacterized protein with von Willebrand factor type A (vWA) domain